MTLWDLYSGFAIAAAVWAWYDCKFMWDDGYPTGSHIATSIAALLFTPIALPWYMAKRSSLLRMDPDQQVKAIELS